MKKNILLLVGMIITVFYMGGCGRNEVDATLDTDPLVTVVKGKSDQKKIYWSTLSDGNGNLKVEDGKFELLAPRRLSEYSIKLSKDNGMSGASEYKIPSAKSLGEYRQIARMINYTNRTLYASKDTITVSTSSKNGYNNIGTGGSTSIKANIDDDKALGFQVKTLMGGYDVKYHAYAVGSIAVALGSSEDKVMRGLINSTKNEGQEITTISNGITYHFEAKKGDSILVNIFKE